MDLSNYSCKFFGGNKILQSFLAEVRKYRVLKPEEEEKLFEKISDGDKKAKDEIVKHNQLFVYSVAKLYAKDEEEVLDYVNEGNIGLIQAIDTFDPSKGFKFITHAVWLIRRYMNYYMTNTNNTIRRPSEMRLGKKITKLRDKFYVEHGYYATDDTIMELVEKIYGIKIKDKSDVMEFNVSSVNEPINDDGYSMESDTAYNNATSTEIEYEKNIDKDYNREVVNNVLEESGMDEKNMDIIKMLFGIGYDRPYTLTEVGAKYNLEERVVNEVKNLTIKYLQQNKEKYSLAV